MSEQWMTFDCFGTLVDWNRGFKQLLEPVGGDRTVELIAAYHAFERSIEKERPHRLYRDVLAEGVRRAAQRIGVAVDPAKLSVLADRWDAMPVFADVEPVLEQLRAGGWKLAVLTNCDVALFARTQARFRRPFDLVVTAEQVKDYKPSLAHFHYFSRVSGVNPEQWVHVACSWYHDIAPARQIGIARIWVDRDHTGDDPTAASLRIEDFAALPASLRQLGRGGR